MRFEPEQTPKIRSWPVYRADAPVWLNGELLVSPATVAGLKMVWSIDDGLFPRKCWWHIAVVWISGATEGIWWGEQRRHDINRGMLTADEVASAKVELQPAAEAECARLAEMLWT